MNKYPKKILTIISVVAVFVVAGAAAILYTNIIKDAFEFRIYKETHKGVPKFETNGKELYKPIETYEDAVTGAVDMASRSVVAISASKDVPLLEECAYDPFADSLPPEFRDLFGGGMQFSRPCESSKTEKKEIGGGSGFVISEDGLILTNKHVIYDEKAEYTVFMSDGKKYPAKVLAKDPVNDIAILKVDARLIPAKLGNSDSIKLGQTAIAIGNALGEYRNTVSVGVISGLARSVTASGSGIGTETINGVIQTDAAINPGNSGGPLLNLRGEVIGINTAIVSGAQNIGFAIPINQAKRAIDSVKKTGSIKTPYLGVRYIMLNEEIAKKQELSITEGALVRGDGSGPAVTKDSPAARAGVKAEDIIIAIDGEKITSTTILGAIIQKHNIGDMVTLSIKRGGETLSLKATLVERPQE
ncbi:MAG: trypsin-like peptidase domain-containing protein [Candidatus Paceibacterota bacterium]|jgi:S1-C subfamily serine protease